MNRQAQCVKTGAVVHLEEYGLYVYTDLKFVGDVWFFLVLTEDHLVRPKRRPRRVHATVRKLAEGLPRRGPPYTLLAHRECVVDHGYDGV